MSKRRAVIAATVGAALLALPSVGLGAITGTVFRDYNSNGVKNTGGFVSGSGVSATDVGVQGVTVRAFDSSGATIGQTTSANNGTYSISATATGTVRVEFSTPAGLEPSFEGSHNATSVQFVDGAGATGVNYAVNVPGEYCQDNPTLVTCLAPATNQMTAFPDTPGVVSTPAAFSAAQSFGRQGYDLSGEAGMTGGVTTVATMDKIGSTFGVGTDRSGNAYFGTYVKRHSPYGPAGATNAVYRVNMSTGATSTWTTLGSETLPAHSAAVPNGLSYPAYSVDGIRSGSGGFSSTVYPNVGRAGLGDVDVTPDGKNLLAVEMTEGNQTTTWPKLWNVPILANGNAGTKASINLTKPATFGTVACTGKWHPMGIGVRGSRVLVGGVCGGNENQFVNATSGRTEAAAFVLELTVNQADFTQSTLSTIAAFPLDYNKAGASSGANLLGTNELLSGLWNNWYDGSPGGSGPPVTSPESQGRSKPMLANVEIMDNGDLTLGFRDRFYDQVKPCGTVSYEWNGTNSPEPPGNMEQYCAGAAAAEILRLCYQAGTTPPQYTREQAGACNGFTGANPVGLLKNATSSQRSDSPLYSVAAYGLTNNGATHPYTGLGGVGTLPGSPVVWSSIFDVTDAFQQGLRALGPCPTRATDAGTCGPDGAGDGAAIGGVVLRRKQASDSPNKSYSFYKGNGLGDLELMCNAAPLQIGNRVWFDQNQNGIQDSGEGPIPGITVHLYNANNTLVGTAVTDASGTYYFQSNVNKPAAGDGTNTGGGLVVGAAFTIKLDNAADFAAGGPLAGWTLTTANATAGNQDAMSTSINSKATLVSGSPTITENGRSAGYNDHTFDIGFYRTWQVYGVGDDAWIDHNGNGVKDPSDPPLPGVTVQLLNPDGTVPNDYYGKPVGPVTTDAAGNYFIGNLVSGTYVARFTLPSGKGYAFTTPGTDSVVTPPDGGGSVGTSAPFTITAGASATTTAVSLFTADFADLNINVGAVVQPLYGMGDYTWIDTNKNGIQDPGEPPLAGVSVQLLNPDGTVAKDHDGNPVAPVVTNADGYYFIGNLSAGSYQAQFTLPSGQGYSFTTPDVGTSGTNSKPTPTTSNPLVGVTATFEIATSATGDTTAVTEPNAQFANLTIDAGVIPLSPVGMGDYTWIDTNRNGIQDPGELPLAGVKVQLLNPDGSIPTDVTGAPVAAVTTDLTGHYLVVNLKPGSYIARFTIPTGYTFTKAGAGTPGTDSNPNTFSGNFVGTTPVFEIASSATGNTTQVIGNSKALYANLTIDAGVVPLVAIGDYVWYDTTKDGIQGRREKPVKGAKVYLLNPDGSRAKTAYGKVAPVLSTNAKGKYLFDSLLPGSYKVRFIYPRGYAGTISTKGTARNDSNPKSTPLNHRVAITPVFTVYDKTQGQTIPQTNPKVNAKFIDPTIDAGIVLDSYSTYVVTG